MKRVMLLLVAFMLVEITPRVALEKNGTGPVDEATKEGPVPFVFTHNGESNFIVQIDCKGGRDYVQNEIGAVNGSAVAKFSMGPCLWDIQADGEWTISPK